MRTLTAALLLTACLDEPKPGLSCEEAVCAHAPACAPLTTGEWDWRSEDACLDTFLCGERPDECLDAVLELPCLSDPPTWEEIEAHTRAMERVRKTCR